jgi:glutamyl endopeptidase
MPQQGEVNRRISKGSRGFTRPRPSAPGPDPPRQEGADLHRRISNAAAQGILTADPAKRGEPELRPDPTPSSRAIRESAPAAEPLLDAAHGSFSGYVTLIEQLRHAEHTEPTEQAAFADDDRRRVATTQEFPWSSICWLIITPVTGPRMIGSGWLVGSRTVITAGHNVFLHGMGGWARQVEVYPGCNGNYQPFRVVSTNLHSVLAWTRYAIKDLDYGAILLPGPIPVRPFAYRALADNELKGLRVNVYGYPSDRSRGTLWGSDRVLVEAKPWILVYDISTFGGQSGCPVFVKEGAQRYGVGIHNYGDVSTNRATRITAEVSGNIDAWRSLGQ